MKRDLRSFMKDYKNAQGQGNVNPGMPSVETIEQMTQKYAGKSKGELMQELQKNIDEQKANGTYTPEMLQRFAAMAAPMMNAEQKARMQEILKQLG